MIEIGDEPRICDTPELFEMMREAEELGLDRQLQPTLVEALDRGGFHALTMVLRDYKAYNETLPTHHRLSVLLKTRDSMHPVCVFLDVTDTWWHQRPTLTEFEAACMAEEDENEGL